MRVGADRIHEQEIDDLVEEWTPEPLVGKTTQFEEVELERRPVIVGYVQQPVVRAGTGATDANTIMAGLQDQESSSQMAERLSTLPPTTITTSYPMKT